MPPGLARSTASTSPCNATALAGDSLRVLANPEPSARDAGAVSTVTAANTTASTAAAENREDTGCSSPGAPDEGPFEDTTTAVARQHRRLGHAGYAIQWNQGHRHRW